MSRTQPLVSIVQTSRFLGIRRTVALICVLLLLSPGCIHKRVASHGQAGKNAYKQPADPRNLSEYIRTVMKLSYGQRQSAPSSGQAKTGTPGYGNAATPAADDNHRYFAVRLQLAINDLKAGAHLAAFEHLDALEREAPENLLVQIQLARLWDAWANYGRAQSHAERAATIEPRSDEAWDVLATASLHAEDFAAAAHAYRKCIELGAETPVRQANLGFALLQQKMWSEAEVHLRRALELDDRLIEARNNLGVTLAYLGRSDDAYSEFLKVSEPAVAWNNLGIVLRDRKLWIEARAAFRQAVSANPEYQKAQLNLAEMNSYLPPPSTVFLPAFPSDPRGAETTQAKAVSPVTTPHSTIAIDHAPARRGTKGPTALVIAQTAGSTLPASVSIRWSGEASIDHAISAATARLETEPRLVAQRIGPTEPSSELDLIDVRPLPTSPPRVYRPAILSGELKRLGQNLSGLGPAREAPQEAFVESIRSSIERVSTLQPSSEPGHAALKGLQNSTPFPWDAAPELGEQGIRALRWQRAFQPGALRVKLSRIDNYAPLARDRSAVTSLPSWLGALVVLFVFGMILAFFGLPLAALIAGLFLLMWLGITTSNTLHL